MRAHRLPVKMVVFNNSTLGMVRLEMLVDGLPDFGVDVPGHDYAAVARRAGHPRRARHGPDPIEAAYGEAFAHPGPALVELITDPQGAVPPAEDHGRAGPGLRHGHVARWSSTAASARPSSMARSNLRNIPGAVLAR